MVVVIAISATAVANPRFRVVVAAAAAVVVVVVVVVVSSSSFSGNECEEQYCRNLIKKPWAYNPKIVGFI